MILVPLKATPNQTLAVTLARQPVQLALRTLGALLYIDVLNGNTPIVNSRSCRDRQRILLDARYHGFIGDFAFVDTQGVSDPTFDGLGSRYLLYYLEAGE